MHDYSAILDPDWFEEMKITKPFGESDEDLYLPINYQYFGETLYTNGFLSNSSESLFLDEDAEVYILRIGEAVPVGDYGVRWCFRWFKSTETGTEKVRDAMKELNEVSHGNLHL